ncbi:translation initiation factor IF-2 [Phormidium sp. LEGE 05292]|uniref:translation initiation factor IF-2 n=1 Tax=[Phormidium] sp. LEGE 05292 TaxID=767427 RepID=UPI001881656C|nr:translation initiation factor IF-2 [Phormidium sp. LEGE 05292]MBE9224680.1 translation initiation factor IF-2 [Phormidium sp. LEGE 05292]
MNNGKVRIYELSRELNLENKDILAICDQLRIPVKSHSSTIPDADAERIRSLAAEKYTAQHSSPTKEVMNRVSTSGSRNNPNLQLSANAPGSGAKPSAPKKQQILGIRQHQEISNNPGKPQGATVAIPPKSPVNNQPTQSSVKPTAPNKPVRPNPQPETIAKEADTDTETSDDKPDGKLKQLQNPPVTPPVAQKPKLVEPPSRPSATSPNTPLPTPSRPQPQQPQKAQTVEQPKADQPKSEQPRKKLKPVGQTRDRQERPEKVAPTGEKPNRASAAAPLPAIPELQRPKPPVRPTAPAAQKSPGRTVGEEDIETAVIDEDLDVKPRSKADKELKRPVAIPPRTAPKKKKWEEEEEEQPQKAAKLAGKGKRSKQIIDEDEIDFDDPELDALAPAIQVSLSVARPPKPKAAKPSQPVPAATLPTARTKPSRDGGSASRAANNRRNREEAAPERPQKLVLTGNMTVQELAAALGIAETEIIRKLFMKGIAVNLTQNLDMATTTMVATELGVEVETAQKQSEATKGSEMIDAEDLEYLERRPPVVTIMGHVDHGKTSLLDAIRASKVAQGEAGGITQHIGAYHVDVQHNGETQQVVFLDTPGHEAFTAMRARGARVTDIAVLVVAADDGVQPQTIEAISHAKAAEVPILVAINKIDKPEAQPDRVKQELTEFALVPEEWGGDTIMVPVSAIQKENLDTLLEMILLIAEVDENLLANPNRAAKGTVIEANLDKSRGPVATLLVQNGTLQVGDILVAGSAFGKVRAMIDDRGQRVDAATPSFAVEVLGLGDVPAAGDEFEVYQDEKKARLTAEARAEEQRQSRLMRGVTLTTLSAQAQEGELKELNLILKADVQGSLEAIIGSLQQLPQNQVQIRILLAAPGEVTQTDVDLAAASNAVIIGFNTTLASGARQAADQAGIDVREYNIIYKLLEDIQGAMEGLLEPELVEEPLGQVEVRAVFPVGRGAVAGCYIQSGKVIRNCKVRVRRNNQVIYEGSLDSLKRMKEDAREVNAGFECGVGIDKFNDWQEGDIIEAYRMVTKRRTLTGS